VFPGLGRLNGGIQSVQIGLIVITCNGLNDVANLSSLFFQPGNHFGRLSLTVGCLNNIADHLRTSSDTRFAARTKVSPFCNVTLAFLFTPTALKDSCAAPEASSAPDAI